MMFVLTNSKTIFSIKWNTKKNLSLKVEGLISLLGENFSTKIIYDVLYDANIITIFITISLEKIILLWKCFVLELFEFSASEYQIQIRPFLMSI